MTNTASKHYCVLCATSAGLLPDWINTRGLCLRGQCSCCGLVAATVPLIPPIVKLSKDSPALYAWMHTCPWEELASVLMASEEDDSAEWLRGKRAEWPVMFRESLTAEHFGDCTKQPITCMRCMAESFKAKVDALRAAVS